MLNERLGQVHFWGSLVLMNAIFLPMFAMGLMGVNRRLYDAGLQYALAQPTLKWQAHMTWSAIALGLFQLPFIANLVLTARRRTPDRENPWDATTLEWSDSARPSLDELRRDSHRAAIETHHVRSDTATSATRLGVWLFLASEAMFFGALFSGYVMIRAGSSDWPASFGGFPWLETLLLAAASLAVGRTRSRLVGSAVLAGLFVAMKFATDAALIAKGMTPASSTFLACWFTLTTVHALHVLAGAMAMAWLAGPSFAIADAEPDRWRSRIDVVRRYWLFVDVVWLLIVVSFYVT